MQTKKHITDIIEEVCGPLVGGASPRADILGYVKCPGEHLHSHETAHRDAAVVAPPNSLPLIRCFHDSCRALVSAMSEELRMRIEDAALAKEIDFTWEPPDEDTMEIWGVSKRAELGAASKKTDVVLQEWSTVEIAKSSPVAVPDDGQQQGRMLLSLFADDDIVWVGQPWHSGKQRHMWKFRTSREWADAGIEHWSSYTTGATYLPGSSSRCNESVLRRRFLIAESDSLSRGQTGAVFRHLTTLGFDLRAVVDSGRRSLHGWFDLSELDAECVAMLEGMLRGFGMDSKTMRASQPVRMAGVLRTLDDGKMVQQSLLYFNPADTFKHA
jgi:hypothetical protein